MVKPDIREHFDLRYVSPSRGNLYWKPRKKDCELYGFERSNPLGRDGPEAWKRADRWNKKLDKARRGESIGDTPAKSYRPGTLGSFFEKFRETPKWETMDARTREDYWRAWEVIEPRYGDTLISNLTAIESERFHLAIHPVHNKNAKDPDRLTWPKAWRVLKGWRGLLNAMEAYGVKKQAPIGRISNPPPPGRAQRWDADEIETLIATAASNGFESMACAIATAWDTLFSPGDARMLTPREIMRDQVGFYIHTDRIKTGKFVDAPISDETAGRIARYLDKRGAIPDDEVIFLSKTGRPWRDHKEFGKEFARVRKLAFGEGEARQFLDIRRSGNTEAWVGGEDRENMAAALGNRIDKNDRLWETYTPPTLAAAREVMEARTVGRARLAATKKAKA